MSATNAAENILLDAMFGNGRCAAVSSTLQFALFTATPGETGGGTEVSGGSYARVTYSNDNTMWPAASGGVKANGSQIVFPTATGSWGTVTHWAIFDGATMLVYGALASAVLPVSGNAPFFAAGDIHINCD